jgi:cell division protein FtsB
MLVRLFFSQGGILDFYDQSKVLTDKKLELEQIRSENMALTREISRMQSDTGYQKKIVRDNLGFIAQDEFLILFPKEI